MTRFLKMFKTREEEPFAKASSPCIGKCSMPLVRPLILSSPSPRPGYKAWLSRNFKRGGKAEIGEFDQVGVSVALRVDRKIKELLLRDTLWLLAEHIRHAPQRSSPHSPISPHYYQAQSTLPQGRD